MPLLQIRPADPVTTTSRRDRPRARQIASDGPVAPPRDSLDAYRAALVEVLAEAPRTTTDRPVGPAISVLADPVRQRPRSLPTAVVLAGHAGAGSTTVALAAAEGLADRAAVQLVDLAEPARCGLVAASPVELGADGRGWRHGRRGDVHLVRRCRQAADAPLELPEPADGRPTLRVLDAGDASPSALPDLWSALAEVTDVVVVTRLTEPGLRQTEAVLETVDRPVLVAAVTRGGRGPARPPLGPRVGRAAAAGRLVCIPWDRRLEVTGLDVDALPPRVARAGVELAARLSLPSARPTAGPYPRSESLR